MNISKIMLDLFQICPEVISCLVVKGSAFEFLCFRADIVGSCPVAHAGIAAEIEWCGLRVLRTRPK